jgi:hypothetical protein
MKIDWAAIKTNVIDFIVAKVKSYLSKDLAKKAAKAIVVNVIKLSGGPLSWLGQYVITKAIYFGIGEAKEFVQELKDNNTIKDGDYLEALPATDEVKKKRKENLKKLLEG